MIDTMLLKIILASLLHDVGKVYQRTGYQLPPNFVKENQDLYQRYEESKGYYTHKHVLFTAKFIEDHRDFIPKVFFQDEKSEYSLINLSASHHKPQSEWQLIIHEADFLSSAYERREFDEKTSSSKSETVSYIPLLSLFEDVNIYNNNLKTNLSDYKYAYELNRLNPENIFPKTRSNKLTGKEAYEKLWKSFVAGFKSLCFLKDRPDLWLESLNSLMLEHFLFVPSATVSYSSEHGFERIPSDISLFDHSYFTASLASVLYLYHRETNTISDTYIKNRDIPKFLFIEGNFYGIQKFIFSSGGETRKWAAKLLRGRSFVVSLYTELVADYILRELNLPFVSLLYSTAGKFLILSPNLDSAKEKLIKIEQEINDWLYRHYYGETSIGIVYLEFKPSDLLSESGYQEIMKGLGKKSEEKKYQKFDLTTYGGAVKEYFERFSGSDVCKLCGKRPAETMIEEIPSCKICNDHRLIGEALVKNNYLLILRKNAKDALTKVPIFDRYSIKFERDVNSVKFKIDNSVLHIWDISIAEDTYDSFNLQRVYLPRKFINAFVPHDPQSGEIISFEVLSEFSIERRDNVYYGISALGVLKCDVDNLGKIFCFGLPNKKRTFTRYLVLSRMIDLFFSYYLPYLCKTKFSNIYNVFCGGDDLFVIGPWKECFDYAVEVNNYFKKYVCENSSFTLSAGYILTKPHVPVIDLAERSEKALSLAKHGGKNRIHVFRTNIAWEDIPDLQRIKDLLDRYLKLEVITNAYLYKLNEIIEMANRAKKMMEKTEEKKYKDAELKALFNRTKDLMWISYLFYFTVRNFNKKKLRNKEEGEKELEKFLITIVEAIEKYNEAMRLPLWQTLYLNRRYGYESV